MRTAIPKVQHVTPRNPPKNRHRAVRLRLAIGLAAIVTATSACSPWQLAWFLDVTEPYREVLSDEQLFTLRWCESTDNYAAVDPWGTYRGAYQFNQSTWDSVASRHFPWLSGIDPIEVEPWWQDAMARALYSERGAHPWPVCGLRL
jgi:Transglycosylase-like domain